MRTFKDVLQRDDEWQNFKNFAYCMLGVVTLVLGSFAGALTVSLFDVSTNYISDVETESTYELSMVE